MAKISMYLEEPRFRIEDVYMWIHRHYEFSPYSISRPSLLDPSNTTMPKLIVLVTCEVDIHTANTVIDYYFEHGPKDQTLLCVMHHTLEFESVEERVRRWAHAGRLRFISLSSHTAHSLRKEANNFEEVYKRVRIDAFPPVFPVPLDPTPPPTNLSIAIQGNFESSRRDYVKTLQDFERILDELPESIVSRIRLALVGHNGDVEVPTKVAPYVSLNDALDYLPYYNLLHQSFVLIPALADEDYYTLKASSSVPASFIANSAILASQRLLETYSYLTADSTWPMNSEAETEMNAIYEILTQHFDDDGMERGNWNSVLEEKRKAVGKRSIELTESNVRLMRDIILK